MGEVDQEFELQEAGPGPELIADETILGARVVSVKAGEHPFFKDDDGNPQKEVNFVFQVTDEGPYENRKLYGRTTTNFVDHENCKLYAWTTELMNLMTLPPKFRLRLPELEGLNCRIVVGVRSWPDKKTGETKSKNEVKEVIRARALPGRAYDPTEEPF